MTDKPRVTLPELAWKLIAKFHSAEGAGKALRNLNKRKADGSIPTITGTTIARWRDRGTPISLEAALEIAKVLGRPANEVLEACGKREELALIVGLFGAATRVTEAPPLSPSVEPGALSLAMQISDLAPDERANFEFLLTRFLRGKVIPARSTSANVADFQQFDRPGDVPAGVAHKIARKHRTSA